MKLFKKKTVDNVNFPDNKELAKFLDSFEWTWEPYYHRFVLPISEIQKTNMVLAGFFLHQFSEMQYGENESLVLIKKENEVLVKNDPESRKRYGKEREAEIKEAQKIERERIQNKEKILTNLLESANYRYHIQKQHEIMVKIPKDCFRDKTFMEFYNYLITHPDTTETINSKKYFVRKHKLIRNYPGIEKQHGQKENLWVT